MHIRSVIVAITLLMLYGCVGVVIGPNAKPTGDGVVIDKNGNTSINLPNMTVLVRVDGYPPDVGFIGPIVPIVPIGPWKWLGFVGRDEYKLSLSIYIAPTIEGVTFRPRSIKILVNGREYSPTTLLQSEDCVGDRNAIYPGEESIILPKSVCFKAKFSDMEPPRPEFTLVAEGLPSIRYLVERKVGASLGGQD